MDTKAKKQKFLEYFRKLPVQKLAAGYVGINQDTVTDWKKADKEFSDQIEAAKSEWAMNLSSKVRSKEWLLERLMRDPFGANIDVTSGGKPLPTPIIPISDVQGNYSNEEDPTTS